MKGSWPGTLSFFAVCHLFYAIWRKVLETVQILTYSAILRAYLRPALNGKDYLMSATPTPPKTRKMPGCKHWQTISNAIVRYFHAYGNWLVSIGWWRFFLIPMLVLTLSGIGSSFFENDTNHHEVVVKSQGNDLNLLVDSEKVVEHGDTLSNLVLLLIVASLILKISYRGQVQAEAAAAEATQLAETESLKRQVMEARMAAMQAQMEPHFLFNTLAGIEHLIETDPPRAALMQKSLIAFLRATMPTLREANAQAERDLGRELAVVKPYPRHKALGTASSSKTLKAN
jgi:hypothetical protein